MSDELKNISPGFNKDTEQEKLLQYLNRNMPDAEQHDFEKQMNEDEFMIDAVEGLQQLNNQKDIHGYVQQINTNLKKQLDKKKKRKDKRKISGQYWTYVSIILLIALVVIAYFILKKTGKVH